MCPLFAWASRDERINTGALPCSQTWLVNERHWAKRQTEHVACVVSVQRAKQTKSHAYTHSHYGEVTRQRWKRNSNPFLEQKYKQHNEEYSIESKILVLKKSYFCKSESAKVPRVKFLSYLVMHQLHILPTLDIQGFCEQNNLWENLKLNHEHSRIK